VLVTVPAAQPDVRTTRTELAKQAFADAAVNATEKVSVDLTERNSRLLQSPIIRNEKNSEGSARTHAADRRRCTTRHGQALWVNADNWAPVCLSVCLRTRWRGVL